MEGSSDALVILVYRKQNPRKGIIRNTLRTTMDYFTDYTLSSIGGIIVS